MATRRLPVIQQPTGEDADAASRPAWQWVLIGSGLLVTIWAPLVGVALSVAGKFSVRRADGAAIGPEVAAGLAALTFALAALAAGYLVARFGPRTRRRHAVFAGLAATAEIGVVAVLGGGITSTSVWVGASALLALSVLSAGACALGALLARRKKPRP
jgi:hypothetical protein